MKRRAMVPGNIVDGAPYWITVLTPTHLHITQHIAGLAPLGGSYRYTWERDPRKATHAR